MAHTPTSLTGTGTCTSGGAPSDDLTRARVPLVGADGQEFVHSMLSSTDPTTAIKGVQTRGALASRKCAPLVQLLDQLGVTRAEAHRAVLDAAKARLLALVPRLPPDALVALLSACFPYVGLPELREVPLAVLGQLRPVPPTFLKQLATDKDLFADLPPAVQREVWELDRKLLQAHALPLLVKYGTMSTSVEALNMDEFLPDAVANVVQTPEERLIMKQRPTRRALRSQAAVQKLLGMIGRSGAIYWGIVDLIVMRLRDSEGLVLGLRETALCSLRSQLLMALHDANATELCNKEPVHKLAWTLDACLRDRVLDARRLRELAHFFSGFPAAPAPRRKADKRARDGDAESLGVPGRGGAVGDEPNRALGDAGMVLRDPLAMYLVINQALRRLEALVAGEGSPAADADLVFMTRLLQLAVACRAMLRERAFAFAPASLELLHTFYPLLMTAMVEAELHDADTIDEGEEPDAKLVATLVRDEVARRIAQVYCLERLAAGDTVTARLVLSALAQAAGRMSDKAMPEWAPFAATLAKRMARMVKARALAPGDALWGLALDHVLLRAVDTEMQVHEEVLRLLLAAAPQLPIPQLAGYLQTTLANSRKSRRRFKRRKAESMEVAAQAGYSSGGGGALGVTSGAGTASEGDAGQAGKGNSGDGVRYIYLNFEQLPGLNLATAPALFRYLSSA